MAQLRLRLEANGRVLLPAEVRRALGVGAGDTLLGEVDENGLRLWTQEIAVRQAQALVAEVVPKNVSLVDALLAERRAENARFDEKFGLKKKPRSHDDA